MAHNSPQDGYVKPERQLSAAAKCTEGDGGKLKGVMKQKTRKIAIFVGNISTEVGDVGAESDRHSWLVLGSPGCRSERTVTRRDAVESIAAQTVRARRGG